jgi:hypothetical protein
MVTRHAATVTAFGVAFRLDRPAATLSGPAAARRWFEPCARSEVGFVVTPEYAYGNVEKLRPMHEPSGREPPNGCSGPAFSLSKGALALVILALPLVGACEESLNEAELARARAAREYDCPPERVRTKWLSQGPNGYQIYKVAACGTLVTYACNTRKEACVKESDDRK